MNLSLFLRIKKSITLKTQTLLLSGLSNSLKYVITSSLVTLDKQQILF